MNRKIIQQENNNGKQAVVAVDVLPAAAFRFERDGDSTVIRLEAESFIIPAAVVFGA
ncbi:hypothetical protein [Seongchinamella sediminis]|uniref:hypothetical protein n=1 Tax=Seongchinamella sediminis TaxID=2283635 RepID=UPI0013C350F1|nr:hypothetical protein [Seongchinamella sediminis]